MEKSVPYQKIIALGKKISSELLTADRSDFTTVWMSHFLAYKITELENEQDTMLKSKLEQECCDTILKIWERRRSMEDFQPLASFKVLFEILTAIADENNNTISWRQFQHYGDEQDSSWGKFMNTVKTMSDTTLSICVCAALTKESILKEKDWLAHKDFLSTEEIELIEYLDRFTEEDNWRDRVRFSGSEPKENDDSTKMTQIFNKLSKNLEIQRVELEKLRNSLKAST